MGQNDGFMPLVGGQYMLVGGVGPSLGAANQRLVLGSATSPFQDSNEPARWHTNASVAVTHPSLETLGLLMNWTSRNPTEGFQGSHQEMQNAEFEFTNTPASQQQTDSHLGEFDNNFTNNPTLFTPDYQSADFLEDAALDMTGLLYDFTL
jgi:hypothetical protein